MIDKKAILLDLINYSNYEKPLTSRWFYERYIPEDERAPKKKDGISIEDYRRQLAITMRELEQEEKKYLPVSTGKGYYIAKNYEEAMHARNWLMDKADDMIARVKTLEKEIDERFNSENQMRLF